MVLKDKLKIIKLKTEEQLLRTKSQITDMEKVVAFNENLKGILDNENYSDEEKMKKFNECMKDVLENELRGIGLSDEIINKMKDMLG